MHVSVLLKETSDFLSVKPSGVYVDATVGGGGHSREIARRIGAEGKLYCFDRDEEAIEKAGNALKEFSGITEFINCDFRHIKREFTKRSPVRANGVIFDLGVSSFQLDEAERGFSYMKEAPLDMRMDRREGLTAYDIVNGESFERLREIISDFGEERYASGVASAIVNARQRSLILTTTQLSDIIKSGMPRKALSEAQHPAKRTFQAIRIAVNDELGSISEALEGAMDILAQGGVLCVITFHSLEDRIVKRAIQSRINGCVCPRDFPKCVCGFRQSFRLLTQKPVTPSPEEISENPRARSAKLRAAIKTEDDDNARERA